MFSRASITMSAGADLVVEGAVDFLEELLVLCAFAKDGEESYILFRSED
jgi:hypothetical protein